MSFGSHVRARRESRLRESTAYSLRQVAGRVGVEPAYLSKVERDVVNPPSERTICRIAADLGEDPAMLLAMAGKVSEDLRKIIVCNPEPFARLLQELKKQPEDKIGLAVSHAIDKAVGEIRDGDW